MSMLEHSFFPITTPQKPNTPYGKKGTSSLAAQLAAAIPENEFTPDPNTPYGEIWMGDHPSNPSSLILDDGSKVPLWKLSSEDPKRYLGAEVLKKFGDTPSGFEENKEGGEPLKHLPFLFKVLSFDRALPLQIHPNRVLSAKLIRRKEQTEALKGAGGSLVDHNYKPEVAVCISEKFDGFIGFRPLLEIQRFLGLVTELVSAIGDDEVVKEILGLQLEDPSALGADDERKLLKRLFSGIMWRKDEVIAEQCQKLATRLDEHGDGAVVGDKYMALGRVIRKCLKDYPNDKAVFVGFLMNLVSLKYGEGVVVGVDEIHAYIEGDIIECMAWGDNMLAHGFQPPEERSSPKVLISSVAFHTHSNPDLSRIPPSLVLPSSPWEWSKEGKTTHYLVPLEEFELIHVVLNHKGDFEETTPFPRPINGPLILIVVRGAAEIRLRDGGESMVMERGRAVFVRPDVVWRITATAQDGADIWGAFHDESGV